MLEEMSPEKPFEGCMSNSVSREGVRKVPTILSLPRVYV
jgi:hypothetical protein